MQEKVLFARQPIFNSRQQVFGYELLFRNGETDKAEFFDGDLATRSVLLNAYTESSAPQVLNGKPGLLNVSRSMLATIPSFAQQFLIIEVLEQEHHSPELASELKVLRDTGFQVALDDFEMPNYSEALLDNTDIVKLDVLTYSPEALAQAVDKLSQHSVRLLAEKVESHDMFNYCQSLGFDLFQGYFFCRPEIIRGHVLDANRKSIFDLLAELYHADVDIDKLTDVVKRDVVLSYKLLKLVNSSFYRRAQQVDSIQHAVMMLGINRIRSWATLVSLGELNHKPDELQTESLLRAYMCEKLGEKLSAEHQQMSFSAGLLSCLDAWFDYPLAELMQVLPLSEGLREAVVNKTGPVGELLSAVVDYMHSQWQKLDETTLAELNITLEDLSAAYAHAIERTDQISTLMTDEN